MLMGLYLLGLYVFTCITLQGSGKSALNKPENDSEQADC